LLPVHAAATPHFFNLPAGGGATVFALLRPRPDWWARRAPLATIRRRLARRIWVGLWQACAPDAGCVAVGHDDHRRTVRRAEPDGCRPFSFLLSLPVILAAG
jgi:hypothetical protein